MLPYFGLQNIFFFESIIRTNESGTDVRPSKPTEVVPRRETPEIALKLTTNTPTDEVRRRRRVPDVRGTPFSTKTEKWWLGVVFRSGTVSSVNN